MLVIGNGWLGSALADVVRRAGGEAWGMRRTEPAAGSPGSGDTIVGDVTSWDALSTNDTVTPLPAAMPARVDVVVLCVSPSRQRGDTHESTYPASARGAVRLAAALGARVLLHVSSTGVYARDDGTIVTETTPVARGDTRQRALADAEDAIWHAEAPRAFGRVVLRVAGLYGPARDPAGRFADVTSLDDEGAYYTNFAWRDDVVSAIRHLTSSPRHDAGTHCYNCADGVPVLAHEIVRALSHAPDDALPPSPANTARTQRTRSNQRVSVDALLGTGWSPAVPDVYRGLELLGHSVRRP